MIFYTIKGPKYKLEIHNDKIKLIKRNLFSLLSRQKATPTYTLNELIHFEIVSPKFMLWGKLEFTMLNGEKINLRFSTNQKMMVKIEKYIQKIALLNITRQSTTKKSRKKSAVKLAA